MTRIANTAPASLAAAALLALAFATGPAAAESSLGEDFSRYSSEPWLKGGTMAATANPGPAPSTAAAEPRRRQATPPAVRQPRFQNGGSTEERPEGGGERR